MDISTSNDNTMFQEAVESGGSSTASLESPSLNEIVNQPPEKALKDLESFQEAQKQNLQEFFGLIKEKSSVIDTDFEARTVIEMKYQKHEELMKEMYQAALEVARKDNAELFTGIIKMQSTLGTEYTMGLVSGGFQNLKSLRLPSNPYQDPLFRASLSIELNKMDTSGEKWEAVQKELEAPVYLMEKEETPDVEKREVPELTKDQLKEVAALYRKMEEDPEFRKQVEAANPQIIESPPQEVKAAAEKVEKESTLWKFAKKGLLYLAIGGVVVAGVYFLGPEVVAWAKTVITNLFGSSALESLSNSVNGVLETVKDGLVFIGDKLESAWNWITGMFTHAEAGQEALREGLRSLHGGEVPNVPDYVPLFPNS